MKAKRVKSLIALLLVLAMMLPTMPFSYADPPAQPKMLDKQKISGPDAQGNYTIKLTVEDTGRPQKHDIVIVFDVSLSMIEDGAGKFNQAKTGAIKFAETLLAGNLKNYNRIAVVSFADKVYAQQNFTNNIDTIKNVINGLQLNENTNIQAGLHQAGEYLKLSKADHKQILLLSDGGPDACYDLKKDTDSLYYGEDFQVAGPNSAAKRYKRDYESKAYLAVERMNYNRLVKNGEVANTTKGMVKIADGTRQKAMVDPANQTYSEAKFLKDAMVTIRVIGYEVDEQTKAQLKEIASENSFYEAGVGQIEDLLAGIGQNFASYKNVKVTDPIGPLFELVTKKGDRPVKATDAITDIVTLENSKGQGVTTAALSADLRTITWTIGTLNGKATMEYKVRLKPGYEGMENNTDNLAMNGNTGFGYDGGSLAFPVPQVPINKVVYKSELPSFYSKAYNYLIEQERDVKGIGDISMPQMPPGKIFVGWKEASTGETLYQKGFKLALGKSYEFTAVWKNNPDIYADALAEVQGGGGTVTAGPAIVEYGKTKLSDIITSTFKPAPAADYLVDKWFIKKGGKLTEIQATHVFKKTDCEVPGRIDLVVTFKKDPTKWATITAESSNINYGTVTGAPLDVKKPTTWGAILQKNHFSADPKDPSKHKFVGWKIQDSPDFLNNDSPINGNVTVVAVFELLKDIKVNVTIEGQGTVGPNNTTTSTTATVKEGTHWRDVKEHFKVQKPGAGYKFDGFYVVVAGQRVKLDPATNDYKFNDTTQIFAVFVKDSEQKEQLTVVVIPEVGKNTLTGSPAQVLVADTWADIMKNPPFTLTLKPGYEIAKWTLDEAGNTLIPDTHKFTKTTTGTKVYAHLREKAGEWFTITVQTGPNGKLEPGSPTTLKVHKDTPWSEIVGKFRPVGNDGYKPGTWTYVPGDGPVNPGDKFNTNKTVKINFVPDDAQKVLVTAVGLPNEMLERINDNPQSVYKFETWAQIKDRFKVVAKTGYEPYKWTFDQQGKNEIPVSHKFTSATTVYVHLREKAGEWFDVTAKAGPNGKLKDGTPTKVRVHKNTPWSQIVGKFSPEGNEGYKPGTWTYFPGTTVVKDGDTFSQPKTVQINFVPDDAQNVDVTLVALPTDKAKVTNSPQSVRKFEKWSEIKGRFTVTEVKGYEAYKYTYDAEGNNVIGENDTFKAKTTIYVHLREKAGEWFTINAIANPNGKLDVNPPAVTTVRVHKDTPWSQIVGSFKPIANEGYKPGPWTHDKEGNTPIKDTDTFGANKSVYINFVPDDNQKVNVTLIVLPADKVNSIKNSPQNVYKFEPWSTIQPRFTVEPKTGYEPKKWTLDPEGTKPIDPKKTFNSPATVYVHLGEKDGEWFTITAKANPNGKLDTNPPAVTTVRVHKDTPWSQIVGSFKPIPDKGFKIGPWTHKEDGSSPIADTYKFTKDETVYVNFPKDDGQYSTIHAKVYNNEGGSVDPAQYDFFKDDTYAKAYDYFEAKEAKGYVFSGWVFADGKPITKDNTTQVVPGDTVYAKFLKDTGEFVKISARSKGNGTVTGDPVDVLKGTTWDELQKPILPFEHKAAPGFKFDKWTFEDGSDIPTAHNFMVNTVIFANFVKDGDKTLEVTAKVYLDDGGTVTPEKDEFIDGETYDKLSTKFKPKEKDGYSFTGWVDKDGKTLNPNAKIKNGDVVYAKFGKLHGQWLKLNVIAVGEGEVKPEEKLLLKDTATGKSQFAWAAFKNEIIPKPKLGFKLKGGVLYLDEQGLNPVPDDQTFNDGDKVYALFERDDDAHMNVLAEADPVAGGTATPPVKNILKGTKWSEIRTDYDAKANPGFTFLGWFVKDTDQPLPKLGDDETLVPDYTFIAPEVTIQARYQENTDEWIWVTPKSKGGGKILVGPAKVYKGSTWEQIDNRFTVSSDPGYRFTHWTDMNGNRLVDTYVFNVSQDIFAHFEAIPAPTPPSPSPGNDRGDDSTDGRGGYQEYNPGPGRDPGNTDNNKPKDEIIEEEDVAKGVLNYNDFYAYIQGYPDGSVRSNAYVNREETAAIFFRLLEPTYKESIRSVNNNFKDITASTWSNKHISTLANGGIIKGYSDGTFRPRAPITRAELAVIAAKFDRLNNNNNHGFKDVNGHWAERYIANANQKGWIKGYPNGEFRPDKPITRAEFVTFVNKVLGRNVKKPEIPQGVRRFTDLKADAWYYENMVTATNSYLATQGNDGFQKWSKLVNIFIEM